MPASTPAVSRFEFSVRGFVPLELYNTNLLCLVLKAGEVSSLFISCILTRFRLEFYRADEKVAVQSWGHPHDCYLTVFYIKSFALVSGSNGFIDRQRHSPPYHSFCGHYFEAHNMYFCPVLLAAILPFLSGICQAQSGHLNLTTIALVNNVSVFQCWQLNQPISPVPSSAGIVNSTMLGPLGDPVNATWLSAPAGAALGQHHADAVE